MQYGWNPERRKNDICKSVCSRRNYLHISTDLLDHTKLMPGRVMVLLVITGVILGAAGIYEPLIKWAGCGASVPLSGFGYNLSKGVIEAVKEEGTIGLFKGGLKAAAAGTSSALIFSYLATLIFQPKMKK